MQHRGKDHKINQAKHQDVILRKVLKAFCGDCSANWDVLERGSCGIQRLKHFVDTTSNTFNNEQRKALLEDMGLPFEVLLDKQDILGRPLSPGYDPIPAFLRNGDVAKGQQLKALLEKWEDEESPADTMAKWLDGEINHPQQAVKVFQGQQPISWLGLERLFKRMNQEGAEPPLDVKDFMRANWKVSEVFHFAMSPVSGFSPLTFTEAQADVAQALAKGWLEKNGNDQIENEAFFAKLSVHLERQGITLAMLTSRMAKAMGKSYGLMEMTVKSAFRQKTTTPTVMAHMLALAGVSLETLLAPQAPEAPTQTQASGADKDADKPVIPPLNELVPNLAPPPTSSESVPGTQSGPAPESEPDGGAEILKEGDEDLPVDVTEQKPDEAEWLNPGQEDIPVNVGEDADSTVEFVDEPEDEEEPDDDLGAASGIATQPAETSAQPAQEAALAPSLKDRYESAMKTIAALVAAQRLERIVNHRGDVIGGPELAKHIDAWLDKGTVAAEVARELGELLDKNPTAISAAVSNYRSSQTKRMGTTMFAAFAAYYQWDLEAIFGPVSQSAEAPASSEAPLASISAAAQPPVAQPPVEAAPAAASSATPPAAPEPEQAPAQPEASVPAAAPASSNRVELEGKQVQSLFHTAVPLSANENGTLGLIMEQFERNGSSEDAARAMLERVTLPPELVGPLLAYCLGKESSERRPFILHQMMGDALELPKAAE